MKRLLLTLAVAGAGALAAPGLARAATVTAVPANMAAVVAGHHPEATVTVPGRPPPGLRP